MEIHQDEKYMFGDVCIAVVVVLPVIFLTKETESDCIPVNITNYLLFLKDYLIVLCFTTDKNVWRMSV